MTPYVDVQSLTKSFGAHILFNNISFSIAEGQHVGLIAKNGTGQTTLLSILAGKESYESGGQVMLLHRNKPKSVDKPVKGLWSGFPHINRVIHNLSSIIRPLFHVINDLSTPLIPWGGRFFRPVDKMLTNYDAFITIYMHTHV